MSTVEANNKELVRRVVEEVFNGGEVDRIDEYVSSDYIGHSSAVPEDIHGREGYKDFVRMVRSASSDFEVTIDELLADGNKVIQRSHQAGTHDGQFLGLEPTGVEFEFPGIVIYEIDNGEIVEEWSQADMMGLMEQLGGIDPPGN